MRDVEQKGKMYSSFSCVFCAYPFKILLCVVFAFTPDAHSHPNKALISYADTLHTYRHV